MNKETLSGKFDQAAGALKQKTGEVLGNQKLANSGAAEQIKGAAKETWGRTKEAAAERSDAINANADKEGLEQRAEETLKAARDKIVDTAQNAKNTIAEKIDSFREQTHRS